MSIGYSGSIEQRWLQLEHALRKVGLLRDHLGHGASAGV
jgi:hypothetical protein